MGNKIGKRVGNELLTRYIFEIPTVLLKKMSEQNIEGKVQFYKEEGVELEHFSKEMCMSLNQLYEKKLHKIVMLMIFFLVNDFLE